MHLSMISPPPPPPPPPPHLGRGGGIVHWPVTPPPPPHGALQQWPFPHHSPTPTPGRFFFTVNGAVSMPHMNFDPQTVNWTFPHHGAQIVWPKPHISPTPPQVGGMGLIIDRCITHSEKCQSGYILHNLHNYAQSYLCYTLCIVILYNCIVYSLYNSFRKLSVSVYFA